MTCGSRKEKCLFTERLPGACHPALSHRAVCPAVPSHDDTHPRGYLPAVTQQPGWRPAPGLEGTKTPCLGRPPRPLPPPVTLQGRLLTFFACSGQCPPVCLSFPVPGGGGPGGQGWGTGQIKMAPVFPAARAIVMMGLIERRSVKRILIDLTSLIRICV